MIMDGPLGAHSSSARQIRIVSGYYETPQMPSTANIDICSHSRASFPGNGPNSKPRGFAYSLTRSPRSLNLASAFGLLFLLFDILRERDTEGSFWLA
jgi:hypothetical protein